MFTDSTGQQEARLTELVILAAQAVKIAIFLLWQGTYYIHDNSASCTCTIFPVVPQVYSIRRISLKTGTLHVATFQCVITAMETSGEFL